VGSRSLLATIHIELNTSCRYGTYIVGAAFASRPV
jgi:hypothetical protein